MKKLAAGYLLSLALISSAYAATTTMKSAPAESWTVTNYYKQAVYDPKETKIGDIDDVLVDKSGKITGLVLGVGGFLGLGEKDVIVPFTAVKTAKKNDKWWLTLDETKDDDYIIHPEQLVVDIPYLQATIFQRLLRDMNENQRLADRKALLFLD